MFQMNNCARLFSNPCINVDVMARTSSVYDYFIITEHLRSERARGRKHALERVLACALARDQNVQFLSTYNG